MGLFDGFQGGEKTAVMSMYDAIKAELDRHEWNYEESEESGENRRERYIYMRNELENDEPVTVVIAIREYDHADGFIKIKINAWNGEFRYAKFCLDRDQDVVVDIDLPLDLHEGTFQPESIMSMMALGMNIVEKVYDDLMGLCTRGHKPRPQE